ncbi:tRNA (adenosine(37)-N6)-threonylcarbamoyltransferase complex dimerization subunit type 1 TsaB [Luteolibacter marinus]|uniref:tRNA (adenosine(37)-N6)-threonylcarbamoyltransferase complex dimerization subunit type 1 TsaB n=1 Tax=Luteolibacter marinus TaxID=2776705 RepID=UPI001867A878
MPDALRLFLESSTPRASLALMRGSEVLCQDSFTSDRNHNAMLFEPLERALACLAGDDRLAEVVMGTGPGSYSGTRVGIAAGQGVALVHGCPAVGLTSLMAVPATRDRAALAIGDARRGSAWRLEVGAEHPWNEPVLCPVEELAEEVRAALDAGKPVFSLEPAGRIGLPEALVASVRIEQPDALALAAAWMRLAPETRDRLKVIPPQPVYLRPPHVTEAKGGHPLLRK